MFLRGIERQHWPDLLIWMIELILVDLKIGIQELTLN